MAPVLTGATLTTVESLQIVPQLSGEGTDFPSPPGWKVGRPNDAPFSAWYALAVLILIALFAAIDRQILILIAEPLRKAFALSDMQLGMLQGVGLALIVGIAAFPIGWLADRHDRRLILGGCILIWSLATVACGLSQNFWQLMLATTVLGIGEAGLAPICFGLIPDLFQNGKRHLANAIFVVASSLTAGVAFAAGGQLIKWITANLTSFPGPMQGIEPWRLSFFLVALPGPLGLLLISTIWVYHREAPADEDLVDKITLGAHLRAHWKLLSGFFMGFGVGTLGIAAAGWIPIIASRVYKASVQEIGNGMAVASIAGLLAGLIGGSLYLRAIKPQLGVRAPLHIMWLGFILAALLAVAMPWITSAEGLFIVMGLQTTVAVVGIMSFPTVVQDLSPPNLRSRMIAISAVVVVGMQACAPILVGALSDYLGAAANALQISVAVIGGTGLLAGSLLLRATGEAFSKFMNESA